jgi:hypothetical protein
MIQAIGPPYITPALPSDSGVLRESTGILQGISDLTQDPTGGEKKVVESENVRESVLLICNG